MLEIYVRGKQFPQVLLATRDPGKKKKKKVNE